MAFSIKTKQVAGVTCIVALAVLLLSAWYISSTMNMWLGETRARAELVANMITQRAVDVVRTESDPATALQNDAGLQSILQSAIAYSPDVLYVEILDANNNVIVSLPDVPADRRPAVQDLSVLVNANPVAQARAVYTPGGKSFEFRSSPLLLNNTVFATVRVGVSTLLLRAHVATETRTPIYTGVAAILLALVVATLLAQVTLRPIHVIRSGLARLGRGELDVSVELPHDAELAGLGDSFKAVTARIAADHSALAGQRAALASVAENLEDAVALFDQQGTLLFANPAMRPSLSGESGPIDRLLPPSHPYRLAVERALAERRSLDPTTANIADGGERLILAHTVEDAEGHLVGVMLVSRNLTYLSQVESTLSYSRKLAALSRLSAGIAHEVKNPLNATMIHLELLKMQLADAPGALEHVAVIAAQMRRLDDVVQGFLKFTRPEDLQLQPVAILPLIDELMPVISAEAGKNGVDVRVDIPADLPPAYADAAMLQQAFLNLALNACQAMPHGGRLRVAGALTPHQQIAVTFEDTGVGISAERPGADFRPLLHDQGTRERHRAVARVPHDSAARRRSGSAVGAGPRHDVPRAPPRGAATAPDGAAARHAWPARRRHDAGRAQPNSVIMKIVMGTRVWLVALVSSGVIACAKVPPRTPLSDVLNIADPPARVLIPTQLAEPEEPPPAPATAPAATPPPRTRENTAARPATDHPVAPATPTVAPVEPNQPAVLQTTADTDALKQQTLSVLAAAKHDLDRVRYSDLGVDARAQYDRAKGFIELAQKALDVKNLMYAQQLAAKAAAVAGLLAKG